MTRLYYTFRFKYNNQIGNDRTSPNEIFRVGYPEYGQAVNFKDLIDDSYLKFTTGERFGYVDIDEETLSTFRYTLSDVGDEIVNNNQIKVYLKDKVKASEWMRNITNFREKEPNIFVIQEASDTLIISPEITLDFN